MRNWWKVMLWDDAGKSIQEGKKGNLRNYENCENERPVKLSENVEIQCVIDGIYCKNWKVNVRMKERQYEHEGSQYEIDG